MIDNTALVNVAYFIAGVLATVVAALAVAMKDRKEQRKNSRWAKIDNLSWHWDFDYTFQTRQSANQIAMNVAHLMAAQIDKTPFEPITVDPGDYTIRLNVAANFVKREN